MSVICEGALVGYAVTKLFNAITVAIATAKAFKSTLKRMKAKITSLKPLIEQREKELEALGRGKENKEFAKLFEEGTELVIKCSNVGFWELYNWRTYSKSLLKLEQSISSYCELPLAVHTNTIALEILRVVTHASNRTDNASNGRIDVNHIGLGFSISSGLYKPPTHTFGLEKPIGELKLKLSDDKVQVLLLCGHGGCGKTTLAKKLCEDSKIKETYGKHIYFLTVSKVVNEMAINQLKTVCNGVNSKQKKLVILDDIWLGSAQIIDDFLDSVSDLKLLVTSRFELPKVRDRYQVKLLDAEDAKKLFHHALSFGNDSREEPDGTHVDKLLKICNGVPLALTVIGSSLKGQHWTVWKTRVAEMLEGLTFLDSEDVVLSLLRTSIDDLDVILRKTFLDLGAFPEDARIPAPALLDISVEMYKEDKNGLYALRNLFQLQLRHLVSMVVTREDTGEVSGFYNEHFVTQHDLLRQLAIFESNKDPVEERLRLFIDIPQNDLPVNFQILENKPGSARLVSITTDETFTSKWIDLQLPEVEVLILNLTSRLYILPNFMKRMNSIKVLIITNRGLIPTELKNLQMLGTLPSLKRIRFERISFASLDESGMHFPNLTKVSFVMCDIQQAFNNCSVQLSEMFPSLEEIDINCCEDLSIFPSGLCDLPVLKRLSLTNCPMLSALPEEISNLSDLQALRLHSCIRLFQLPKSIKHLQKLKLLDISDCSSLDHLPKDIGNLVCLETLLMTGCADFLSLPSSVSSLVNLRNVYCDKDTADLWKHLENPLKDLSVKVVKKEYNLKWLGLLRN